MSNGELILYTTDDGKINIQLRAEDRSVWLNQQDIAVLFDKSRSTIAEHIAAILQEGELVVNRVCRNFRQTAADGKVYKVIHYNLEMIIAVGYRVRSVRGTQFRRWATTTLQEYLIKGFVLDDARLKELFMKEQDFNRWFNNDFWKAFRKKVIPIQVPKNKSEREAIIEKVFNSVSSARYVPSIPEFEIILNKGFGVARTVPVFCIEDYCVYYFCIKELENILCVNRTKNTFGGWKLGGELRKKEQNEIKCESTDYGRYSFNPLAWAQAFGEFNAILYSQIDQTSYSHVLQLDLANFYDCIRLDILERRIREEAGASQGWIISLLFYLLNHWNRRNTERHPQTVGLPQDALADCSRILANYYLQKYDVYAETICTNLGAIYLRYADDQIILLNDQSLVEFILLLLTRQLDKFGLRVNQKKVVIWERGEFLKHRFRDIHKIFSEIDSNKDPSLVEQFVREYLKIQQNDLEKSWNGGLPLLNRLVFANLENIPKDLFDPILSRFTSEKYLLLADASKIKRVYELNKLSSNPIDFEQILKDMAKRSVHNAFHYELISFSKDINNNDLREYCEKRIRSIEEECNSLSQKIVSKIDEEG